MILTGLAGLYGADKGVVRFCGRPGEAHGYRVLEADIAKRPIRAFGAPR